ncbi:UNVERIFIED_CONTAM: penicillin-binding protein 2, partial [Lactiplantibacillus plantarum]|nr:penicillin-binding protein 2 [Lactiplantibacillus plantarum]
YDAKRISPRPNTLQKWERGGNTLPPPFFPLFTGLTSTGPKGSVKINVRRRASKTLVSPSPCFFAAHKGYGDVFRGSRARGGGSALSSLPPGVATKSGMAEKFRQTTSK